MQTHSVPSAMTIPPLPWRGHRPHQPHYNPSRTVQEEIPAITGPLARLRDRRVLVILDTENLTISGRNLGYELIYSKLANVLTNACRSTCLHAVLSVDDGDEQDRKHMETSGFHVHTRLIRYLSYGRKTANADNLFAFKAGALVTRSNADVVLLGSGDGPLCDDVVQCVKTLPGKRDVMTISVAGATSSLLNARTHAAITENIEIGLDVLSAARREVAI